MRWSKRFYLADINEDDGLLSLRSDSLSRDEALSRSKEGQFILVVRISKNGYGHVRPLVRGDLERDEQWERTRYKSPDIPVQVMFQKKFGLPRREKNGKSRTSRSNGKSYDSPAKG